MSYIVAKQTAAKTSENINLTRGPFPKVIHVVGLLVAETIAVNVVDLDDAVLPLYDTDGVAVVIAVDSIPLEVPGPITLQFVKPTTANEVGLQLVEISV
jgi:hypothetical protein